MVPFRLAKMKRADVPFTRKDEVSVLATWAVGPWAGPLPCWDNDIAVGPRRDRFHEGWRHLVQSGCIGTLVRNPNGARGVVGNTPRVMQLWVSEGGEPRDIRNEIC